jgi:Arc/MetJ family transcription regulator
MTTTVDIPDDILNEAKRLTKTTSERDAIVSAMREYIRREKVEALLKVLGTSETFMTQEELMDMRHERGKYAPPR